MAITKINTPELFDLGTTNTALRLPSGDTASRPSNPNTGEWRYNTDDNYVEYWDGTAWFQIDYETVAPTCTTNTINYPTAVTAYYKMEDATDQTGNYNGTPTNVNFNVAGKFGNAGEFNGSSSYIQTGYTVPAISAYALSLWFKSTSTLRQYLFSDYNPAGNDVSTRLTLSINNSGNFVLVLGNGSSAWVDSSVSASSYLDGNWHNLVLVINGTSVKLYADGNTTPIADLTSTVSAGTAGTEPIEIGTSGFGSYFFNGSIDQVRIFPSALTSDQATQLYNEVQCAPTIVPSKHFNVNTYVGNGSTQNIDAKFNEAAVFNGSSSYINVNSISDVMGQQGSISAWVNVNDFNTKSILGIGLDTNNFIKLEARTNNNNCFSIGGRFNGVNKIVISDTTTLNTGQWYHIAATTDGSSYNLYVNGQLQTLTVLAGTNDGSWVSDLNGTPSLARIGSLNRGGGEEDLFNGKIDQVRLFPSALTQQQVTELYTNETTATAQLLDFPVGAGCIAAYELDGDASDVGGTYGGVPTDIGYTGMQFAPDMVWTKARTSPYSHNLQDTVRGGGQSTALNPNLTLAEGIYGIYGFIDTFNTNGFTVTTGSSGAEHTNSNGVDYVAWCWKAGGPAVSNTDSTTGDTTLVSANQDAGFSIVSLSKTDLNTRTYGHGLSSAPEMIILKRTASADDWYVYHKDLGNTVRVSLNSFAAKVTGTGVWGSTTPTDSVFTLQNQSGGAHIAYCFRSVDGMSKVGSYVGTGATGNTIVTGFEPAFVMVKSSSNPEPWFILDNKRDPNNPRDNRLMADSDAAETDGSVHTMDFNSNGFTLNGTLGNGTNGNGVSYIFLAIAANPRPAPVLANSFDPVIYTGTGTTGGNTLNVSGFSFNPDFVWVKNRTVAVNHYLYDSIRGTGAAKALHSNTTSSEATASAYADNGGVANFIENGFVAYRGTDNVYQGTNLNGNNYVAWGWKAAEIPAINSNGTITSLVNANQAAGFSIVKYTGNGSTGATVGHGLNSPPELIIYKRTDVGANWIIKSSILGVDNYLIFGQDQSFSDSGVFWNSTLPNSSVFTLGNSASVNVGTYIAYCFRSVPGYQKVGSYQGSTTAVSVTTGFQPRFVLVKGTTEASNWTLWDSTRGGSVFLQPNNSGTEASGRTLVFNSDGFTVNTDAGVNGNNNNQTYIYLAIG